MFLEHHIIIISVGSCEISEKSKRYFNTKWTIGDNGKVHERLIYDSDWCFVALMRSERRCGPFLNTFGCASIKLLVRWDEIM